MNLKKIAILAVAAFPLTAGFGGSVIGQERPRVVKTISSRPVNEPPATSPNIERQNPSAPSLTSPNSLSRPVLTNKIEVRPSEEQPLIK
ncbi:MAG: hypothetical protein ACRD43_14395, partial [Pyrinomonadaceae bacterium]